VNRRAYLDDYDGQPTLMRFSAASFPRAQAFEPIQMDGSILRNQRPLPKVGVGQNDWRAMSRDQYDIQIREFALGIW
jgi:hypothetical protein